MRVLHLGWGFSPWRPGGLIAYAEDLMDAQIARGHEVSYFFSGRHYPWVPGPRLKRWRRRCVQMYEVINAPILAGLEHGTRDPDADLGEPRMEAAYRAALGRLRPDLVHIQELHGLPSSFIEITAARGVPMVMTLQDYGPLCSTLRLFDASGHICMRRDVGADCVERNAKAPADAKALIDRTVEFEIARLRRLARVSPEADFTFLAPVIGPIRGRIARARAQDGAAPEAATPDRSGNGALAAAFQRRRDVNVARLGKVDRLIAQSHRVAEIYGALGVQTERMSTLPFTLAHIRSLRPRELGAAPEPVTFATLNGCASRSKGSHTMRDALRVLRDQGLDGRFRLRVLGYVDPEVREELAGFASVELAGVFDRTRLDEVLDDVDVGIMPSMWEEALGYIGLELLSKGIPLIANPLGGIVQYAREGRTAWLNRSCTGQGIAEIVARLVHDPGEVLRMHRSVLSARDDVAIPMGRHVDAMEEIYRDLTRAPRTPGTRAPAAG